MDTHGNSADGMADRADIAHNYHAARRRALAGFTAAALLLLLAAESQPSDRPAAPAAPLAVRDYELERQLGIMDTEGDYELEVDPDSEPAFETTSDITDWLNATVATIFTTPTCGDFACDMPEEYPSYDPGGDARQDFSPCEPDCGSLNATLVSMRVTFSDIVKLRAAYDAYDALVAADSYAGSSASAWGVSDRSPVGGWNICSRDKTECGEPDLERAPGG